MSHSISTLHVTPKIQYQHHWTLKNNITINKTTAASSRNMKCSNLHTLRTYVTSKNTYKHMHKIEIKDYPLLGILPASVQSEIQHERQTLQRYTTS